MRLSTGRPNCSPATLPSHHGNVSRLLPAELGGVAARERPQAELADAGDRAPVLDAHHRARAPTCVTTKWSVVCSGPTRVRQSNSAPTPACCSLRNVMRLGVEHPLGVGLDVLDGLPHGRRAARRS